MSTELLKPQALASHARTVALSLQRRALNLDFLAMARGEIAFSSAITFSRASTATRINPSTGLVEAVAADVPRLCGLQSLVNAADESTKLIQPGFLIEGTATNLILNSDTLTTQSVTVSAQVYVLSIYGTGSVAITGTFTGSISGTGASNRRYLSFAPTAGTLTLTVSGSVTNCQLETGTFPTSYIQTAGAAVTRAADIATLDVSKTWNATEGAIVCEADFGPGPNGFPLAFTAKNAAGKYLYFARENNESYSRVSTDLGLLAIGSGSIGREKLAVSYSSNATKFSIGGGVPTSHAYTFQTMTQIVLGEYSAPGVNALNGTIQSLHYFPYAYDDYTLKAASEIS